MEEIAIFEKCLFSRQSSRNLDKSDLEQFSGANSSSSLEPMLERNIAFEGSRLCFHLRFVPFTNITHLINSSYFFVFFANELARKNPIKPVMQMHESSFVTVANVKKREKE